NPETEHRCWCDREVAVSSEAWNSVGRPLTFGLGKLSGAGKLGRSAWGVLHAAPRDRGGTVMANGVKGRDVLCLRTIILGSLLVLVGPIAVPSGSANEEEPARSPDRDLPPHITRLTLFGERADFSHEGKRVLFVET